MSTTCLQRVCVMRSFFTIAPAVYIFIRLNPFDVVYVYFLFVVRCACVCVSLPNLRVGFPIALISSLMFANARKVVVVIVVMYV